MFTNQEKEKDTMSKLIRDIYLRVKEDVYKYNQGNCSKSQDNGPVWCVLKDVKNDIC